MFNVSFSHWKQQTESEGGEKQKGPDLSKNPAINVSITNIFLVYILIFLSICVMKSSAALN